jgi:hypothetical protein
VSLIDDALKRAQEAAEKAGPPRDRPWVPAPLPDPAIARRRRLIRLLAITAAAAVVVAIGVWAVRAILRSPVPRPAETPPENRAPVAAVVPTPEPTLVPVAVPPSVSTARPAPRPSRQTPIVDTEGLNAGVETKVPALPGSERGNAERGSRTHAGSVTLPGGAKIELGGIVWSETEPRALINDRIVGVGGYVEGYTLAKIEEDRITLEKDGATLVLTVK